MDELTVESAEAQYEEAMAAHAAAVAAHEAVGGPRAALIELEGRIHAEQAVSRDERRLVNQRFQQSEAAVTEARIWLEWSDRCARVARGEHVEHGFPQTVGGPGVMSV